MYPRKVKGGDLIQIARVSDYLYADSSNSVIGFEKVLRKKFRDGSTECKSFSVFGARLV